MFLAGLLLMTGWIAQASSRPIEVLPGMQRIQLDSQVTAQSDPTDRWGPDQAWQELDGDPRNLSFSYQKHPVWVRVDLLNRGTSVDWTLITYPAILDEVDLFVRGPEDSKWIASGRFRADRSSPEFQALDRRKPSFAIQLPQGRAQSLLLRVRSMHALDLSLLLEDSSFATRSALTEFGAHGLYFGVCIALFFLNLLIYSVTRDRSHLDYVFFVFSLATLVATLIGFSDFFLHPGFAPSRYLCVLSALVMLSAHQFTRSFLRTHEWLPRHDLVHRILMGVGAFIAVLGASPWFPRLSTVLGYFVDFTIVVSVALVLTSAVRVFRRGFRPARFFLLAWTAFLGMTLVYFTGTYGLLPGSALTHAGVEVGSAMEMILLSLALGDRIHSMVLEKRAAEIKARQTDSLRSLVHIVCHDLASPLTVIQTLSEAQLPKNVREWNYIHRAGMQLRSILEHVRSREAVESGKAQDRREPVSLKEVIENARFVFQDPLERKKLRFTAQVLDADGAPGDLRVLADPVTLSHTVINNLVSNAIKFSHEGSEISLNARPLPGEPGCIEIRIQDRGIGIPPELLPKLFASDQPTTRIGTAGERGTGFGMPLVKSIIDSLGGTIEIESRTAELAGAGACGTSVRIVLQSRMA